MAIVTDRTPSLSRAEAGRRVKHPLESLRSTIRFYVAAEGVAILVIFLALWFWIGLLLDYGVFKLLTIDWVQELPHGFRVVVLCGLVAGLLAVVTLKVILRLFREFRDSALALVLERRFPQLLGDRLITAVELADPAVSEKYGYSQVMVDETIRDAADGVERLSVKDVFNWSRLRRRAIWIVGVTAGCYVLAGAVYCAFTRTMDAGGFFSRFNDVAAIWFERNVLLYDTIWPRHAHLELLDFPGDEIRLGRDSPPPTLRVRALKWMIADKDRERAPEGWRPLMWADLSDGLLGEAVPTESVPVAWSHWRIDQIEMELEKADVNKSASEKQLEAVRGVLAQLEKRAASSSMSRRLRQLEMPSQVRVLYRGATTKNEQDMAPGLNHEYSATLASLRESLRFTVQGEDYYTPSKRIIVVPPPSVIELTVTEAQPAYLHHRVPADGTNEDLRGKKQMLPPRPVSLTGEKSSIQVPVGTDLVVMAKVDKPLQENGIHFRPYKPGAGPFDFPPIELLDDNSFQARFSNVTTLIDFFFEFVDSDNVVGRRHVEIKPIYDTPPEVDVQVEVIRKSNQVYLVTPQAMIPFSGKVRDDRGLTAVEYLYTKELVESAAGPRPVVVAATLVTALHGDLTRHLYAAGVTGLFKKDEQAGAEKPPERVTLATFDKVWREDAQKAVSLAKFTQMLNADLPPANMLKNFELDPDFEVFAVSRLGLKVNDDKVIQPHYRLRLWVAATDNNVERKEREKFVPGIGLSKEKFTFMVVSENELLAEIAKEEEGLHVKLEEAVNRLKDGKLKLDKVVQELPELKPEEFSPMARRAEEVQETLTKSWDTAREVYNDYRRILKELKANQVNIAMINKVNDKICEPLDGAITSDFSLTDEAIRAFQKKLDEKVKTKEEADKARVEVKQLGIPAQERLLKLINRLSEVLDAMGDISTVNKLITALLQIEKKEREEFERLRELYKKRAEELLDDPADKPKDKK
jgi:hypothetical protein